MNSRKKTARMAGGAYLLFMATLIFSSTIRSKLVVFGAASATASNISNAETLFRIGFMSELVSTALFLVAAWILYVLLKPVKENLALLFVLLNFGGVAIQCVSLLAEFAALLVLSGADYLNVFPVNQLHALAMLFLNVYENGFMIAQFFFATWLFPLGFLVFKSGFLPKILGLVLMIECFAWLTYFFQFFFFPGREWITYPCMAIGLLAEASLTLWLLIVGVKKDASWVNQVGLKKG